MSQEWLASVVVALKLPPGVVTSIWMQFAKLPCDRKFRAAVDTKLPTASLSAGKLEMREPKNLEQMMV